MQASDTPFLLPEIITGIDSTASVKELLDLYAGPLTAENKNNSIPVIVPVSHIRMVDIVERYKALESAFQTTFKLWEELANRSLRVTKQLESIAAIVASENPGTDILMNTRKGKLDIENANKALKSVFIALNEYEFKLRHIAWEGYLLTHERLDELVQKEEHEPSFVIKELETISESLKTYQQAISWTSLRAGIPGVLQTFISLYTVTPHNLSLLDFINLVRKHKATNPLISDKLVEEVNDLDSQLNTLLSLFNAAINSIYRSEVRQEEMIDSISIYQMILNRLFSAGNAIPPEV